MWKDFLDYAKQLLALAQDTRENKAQIEKQQRQIEELTLIVQRLMFELLRDRDLAARNRENLLLRLENEMLKFERRLPSSMQEKSGGNKEDEQ
jgi:hypothetical protein